MKQPSLLCESVLRRLRPFPSVFLPLLAACLFVVGTATAGLVEEIGSSDLADKNVKAALEVLKNQIGQTRQKLPASLTNDFAQALETRLETIRESVSHNLSKEYKSALMAKRILELAENVLTLPSRKIPEEAGPRQEAQQQYAAVLDRFKKAAPEKMGHLDEQSRNLITGALQQILTEVQQDLFRPGFGRPLESQDQAALNRIADDILQAAAALPAASDKKGSQASDFREAAKVANEGRNAALAFLRGREKWAEAPAKAWYKENAALIGKVDRDVQSTEEEEINAVIGGARRQGEKDIRENDPKRIEKLATGNTRTSWTIRIAVLSGILVGLVVLTVLATRSKRKSR